MWGLWEVRHTAKEQHPLPPSLPCFGVCSGNVGGISDGLIPSVASGFSPGLFFFLASLALVWSLMLGGCSSVIGRQWKACLGCLCCRLVPADEIKQQSDPVTTLSHILQTCFAWPTLFLALCSSPGLFYIDRLTIFSPSLSLPCLVCEYKPKCLPKVENRWHFSVFGAYEILKDFWENNVVWGGVKISIRLSFLSAESWHWVL